MTVLKRSQLLLAIAVLLGATAKAESPYGKLPLQFEPNAGQADPRVKFLARGPGFSLALTATEARMPGGLRMAFSAANERAPISGLDPLPGKVNYLSGNDPAKWHTSIATYGKVKYQQIYPGVDLLYYGKAGRLEYDLIVAPGADPSTIRFRLDGAKFVLDRNGDIVLNAGRNEVRLSKPDVYQMNGNVKKRIGATFAINKNNEVRFQLAKYDHRRALVIDPVVLYASYLGGSQNSYISGVAVNASGQLYVTGYTYTTNFPVTRGALQPANATNANQNTAFADAFVSKISADGTTLIYSTYLGGDNDDVGRAIAVDSNDNAYVTGYTISNNFPVTADAIQGQCGKGVIALAQGSSTDSTCEGSSRPDVFLTKLNPAGQLLYSTFIGGSGNDSSSAVGLDPAGNVYIAGSTNSLSVNVGPNGPDVNYPETASAFEPASTVSAGGSPFVAFLTKLSPDLHSVLYSSILGGGNVGNCGNGLCGNFGQSLAVGQNGIAYLGGYTSSASFPVTAGALQTTCPSCVGNYGGTVQDTGFISAFDTTRSGAASLVFSTYFNGSAPNTTYVTSLAADSQNNVYAAGTSSARDFPATAGSYSPNCSYPDTRGDGVCGNAFVLKMNATGSLVWSTYYGSTLGYEFQGRFGVPTAAAAIALDGSNNVYLAGGGLIDIGLPQVNAASPPPAGGRPVFLATFSADGSTLLFASYFGGTAVDTPAGIALDHAGNIYFAGTTSSTDVPVTAGAVQTVNTYPGPGSTGFFAKVSCLNAPCPSLPSLPVNAINLSLTPASAALGQTVTLTATVSGPAGQPVPTGTVTFSTSETTIGSAPLNNSGIATVTTSSLAAGSYEVFANYSGDSLYLTSTSAAEPLTVQPAPTSTGTNNAALTFSASAQMVTLSATVTGGLGTVTAGSVAFTLLGTTISGPVSNGTASASFSVPGNTAAGTYPIQAAYSGIGNLAASSDTSKHLTIGKATPVVTFSNPADITQGTALGSTQLNATANVAGTFVYTPQAGTVLAVGDGQALSAVFTPTDTTNYNPVTSSAQINVKAPVLVTTVTTASNAALTFSASAQTVTVTATVSSNPAVSGGSVTFTLLGTTVSAPVAGGSASAMITIPAAKAVGNYPIHASYTPSGNFTASTDNAKQLSISKATPVLTFTNPADITVGTPLGSTQLNATANVPGAFTYTPPSGTVLAVGNGQTLSASFTPTDATDYNTTSKSAQINVKAVVLVSTVTTASNIALTFSPTAQSVTLTATVSSNPTVSGGSVTFTLLGINVSSRVTAGSASAMVTVPAGTKVGTYPIHAAYTPSGNFTASSDNSKQLSISQATPTLTFANSADITVGTALSSAQLNATASVPGSFVYAPPSGTMLPVGTSQSLSATFTPSDTEDYKTATATAHINVKAIALTPASISASGVSTTFSPASQVVSLSAVVKSTGGGTPTGSVNFTLLGTHVSGPLSNGTAAANFTIPGGTKAGAYPITAAYVPTGSFSSASDSSKQLSIAKASPSVTFPGAPIGIPAGLPLSIQQLNATANVPGTFVYNPPFGTALPPNNSQRLSVVFTPSDFTDYTTASVSVLVDVYTPFIVTQSVPIPDLPFNANSQPLVMTANIGNLSAPSVTAGTVLFTVTTFFLGGSPLNVSASAPVVNGTASATVTIPGGANGNFQMQSFYTPALSYLPLSSGFALFAILNIPPNVAWTTPTAISFGTALSSDQLNAVANVPGTYTYDPPAGRVLPAGPNLLTVRVDPLDPSYPTLYGAVTLNVIPLKPAASPPVLVGSAVLSRDPVTHEVLVRFTAANSGGSTAPNVRITSFTIYNNDGAFTTTPLPQNLGSIAPGAVSTPIVFRFPPILEAGTGTFLNVVGDYLNYSSRITIP
jgi:hypothetical protein